MNSVSIQAENSVKARLANRMPYTDPCGRKIHPSFSGPLGSREYMSVEVSACIPFIGAGDGVGADIVSHCRREVFTAVRTFL